MILTYKIKHGLNITDELIKAGKIAEFAVKSKNLSSASVKHIGLKSIISNQILRKYGRNRNIKRVSRVNLVIPNQGIKFKNNEIYIPCLKANIPFNKPFTKINQIELNQKYAFISVTVQEKALIQPSSFIGIDLNTTGHCAVLANPTTGKVVKLGKKAYHTHNKYKNIRRKLQNKAKYKLVKKIKNRESRIVRDLNHKISRKVVDYALKNNAGIVLEDLSGIRKTKKQAKSFKYSLHSWSFYQLRNFIEYKAKLNGIPVFKIEPFYTSQQCSRCGCLGTRIVKQFKCSCGHVEHADVNAAFVIAERHQGIVRKLTDRDVNLGSSDTPREATLIMPMTSEPPRIYSGEYVRKG